MSKVSTRREDGPVSLFPFRLSSLLHKRTEEPRSSGLPKAIVFVDFEYWTISQDKLFHLPVNPLAWYETLKKSYDLVDIRFYGDFSNERLRGDIERLREISHQLIETRNVSSYYKKDFTDFILLDGIYQTLLFHNDFDTYILFTGDGHFCPVVSCLRDKCKKEVVVYGIRGSFNNGLKKVCSSYVELPEESEVSFHYEAMVLSNLEYLEQRTENAHPTFWRTIDVVAEHNNVDRELIKAALLRLKEKGYIRDKDFHVGMKRTVPGIAADWEKLQADRVWPR